MTRTQLTIGFIDRFLLLSFAAFLPTKNNFVSCSDYWGVWGLAPKSPRFAPEAAGFQAKRHAP